MKPYRLVSRRLVVFVLALIFAPVLAMGTAAAKPLHVIAFGDSLTAGYGLPAPESVPARLQAALRADGLDVTIVNAGVSGDTTSGGKARLDWVLATAPGGKPDLVILELGANDALRGIDPALTRSNLDAILATLTKRGIPVLLTGMKAPPNMGPHYVAAFDGIYPDLAKKYGVAYDPFYLEGVAAVPSLNQSDGMHPNAEGTMRIAQRLKPIVAGLLKNRAAKTEGARKGKP